MEREKSPPALSACGKQRKGTWLAGETAETSAAFAEFAQVCRKGAQPTPRHGAHFQKTTSANMGNSSKYDNELEISIPPHWLPP
ncbi:uncharacterized protein TrAFT101_003723 [Trichoderma asperellum]|uniref:uncharacterized protein n=1 Tax=Trichoderma asperellum TaxID=101201 RepID=UPI003333A9CA|nr:hypothetical protein TrAFT101_003723 [Trichoderma asperellum]